MQTGRGLGMATLNDSLVELVKKKIVEPGEAYAKAVQKTEFEALLRRHNIKFQPPSEDAAAPAPARQAAAAEGGAEG
jgi:twitching motility protein PilT